MRILDDELVLSPSDLTGFAACAHLTQLELAATRGELTRPDRKDPLLDVLSRLGSEHEDAILASELAVAGRTVVTISTETRTRVNLERRAAETAAAMEAGADVIYQGVFFDGRWAGYADFLERVPRPSQLGDWSYEVADAKLARSVKASAILQLSAYTEWVARIQGIEPVLCHVLTGDGERHSLRVADFAAYYRRLKAEFEARVLGAGGIAADPAATCPEPVEHCSICRWSATCAGRRRADDHLSLVAGIRRQPRGQLVDAGITTRRAREEVRRGPSAGHDGGHVRNAPAAVCAPGEGAGMHPAALRAAARGAAGRAPGGAPGG